MDLIAALELLLSGIMLSGNECSQILLSIVLTYFAGNGHRPRLVSLGMLFSGIASLLVVVPHFVYVNNAPVAVNGERLSRSNKSCLCL